LGSWFPLLLVRRPGISSPLELQGYGKIWKESFLVIGNPGTYTIWSWKLLDE